MKISQSLLKSIIKYRNDEECGLVFKAKYIDGRYDLFPASEAQNLGAWFEYMATGSIPKNGDVPKANYMKRGKDSEGKPALTADYKLMTEHIQNYKNMMEAHGFELIRVGEDIKALLPNSMEIFGFEVWLTGTLDIRARATKDIYSFYQNQKVLVAKAGQVVIIDLKVSGLLDDKFNLYGWELNNLHNKINLVTQPIQYKYIELLNTGEEPPFLFMLFGAKNSDDARIIDFKLDEVEFDLHKQFIISGVENMLHFQKVGYKAKPSLVRCSKCPLRENCQFRATVAPITVYYFGNQA